MMTKMWITDEIQLLEEWAKDHPNRESWKNHEDELHSIFPNRTVNALMSKHVKLAGPYEFRQKEREILNAKVAQNRMLTRQQNANEKPLEKKKVVSLVDKEDSDFCEIIARAAAKSILPEIKEYLDRKSILITRDQVRELREAFVKLKNEFARVNKENEENKAMLRGLAKVREAVQEYKL